MRKAISVSAGCLVAAVLTHGLVSSGKNLTGADQLPFFSYRGFFTHVIFGIWRLWTLAHASASVSILHARETDLEPFGRFLAIAVLAGFPLIGFAVAAFTCRQRISWQWLLAFAIGTVLALWDVVPAIPNTYSWAPRHIHVRNAFTAAGFSGDFADAGRAVVVMLLLLWSAGVIGIRKLPG